MLSNSLYQEINVLFITSEVYPLIKTGGLGDVSAALPTALQEVGVDIRILIPGYPKVLAGLRYKRKIQGLHKISNFPSFALWSGRLPASKNKAKGIRLYVIDCPELYQRDGGPYTDMEGKDWHDNLLRFALLSKIGATLASEDSPIRWCPNVVHCNDWQSGLTPAYLHYDQKRKAVSLMAIHNLAFQGVFPPSTLSQLNLPESSFHINGIEYYGDLSFLKAGLYYSDHIVTVSPTYAKEIQKAPLGFGLQGLLASRRKDISGIVNGIDTTEWDPATDPCLIQNYTFKEIAIKSINKSTLQKMMELEVDLDIPLFGMVSRHTYQKGCDLLLQIAPFLARIPVQLIVLGSGDIELDQQLAELERLYPRRIAVRIGFDEVLSHLIEGGVDCFLMPSRFEPCGLNQMYSQRYGTPPLVHATGGLIDTVVDCIPETLADGSASGFLFNEMNSKSFLVGINRVIDLYKNKEAWRRLQRNGMSKDFSWQSSAAAYNKIYLSILSR